MKSLTSTRTKSFKNDSKKKTLTPKIERIESLQSIEKINRLQEILTQLEQKCNVTVAEKYLNGYLENEDTKSFDEFISKLK